MTNFVLVHGSTQNSRCWDRVAHTLRSKGHSAIAPDLPKRAPQWHLKDYAAAIAEHIDEVNTVVVGHSFSGVFLPMVASSRQCTIVFLAAVIPEPQKSVRDQFAVDGSMFSREWVSAGSRWQNPAEYSALAKEFLFHDCDGPTLEWALSTIELFDNSHLGGEASPITRFPDVPAVSIVPSGDRTISPEWMKNATRSLLRLEPLEVDAGHCPHVLRPEAITEILVQTAQKSAG